MGSLTVIPEISPPQLQTGATGTTQGTTSMSMSLTQGLALSPQPPGWAQVLPGWPWVRNLSGPHEDPIAFVDSPEYLPWKY